MLVSRFWYVLLGLGLSLIAFTLYVGTSMFDRASQHSMSEALAADAQVVTWYLKDDARRRSSALVNFALDDELSKALAKATASSDRVPAEAKDKAKRLLRTVEEKLPADLQFTALFAVDQHGRVVAQFGFDQASGIEDFELGGYSVVADALHGWVRDDAWVIDGRIYRIVARPVEGDTTLPPAGAIVGARIVDDSFARDLSKRTSSAVAFFAAGTRVASAAPDEFDAAQLDAITADLASLSTNETYQKKGRSDVRILRDNLGVVYAKIPGEAWDLGAGFAVGRAAMLLRTPLGFLQKGDDTDKHAVKLPFILLLLVGAAGIGLFASYLEHTQPLSAFRTEAQRLARGEIDHLAPGRFRGAYRKLASDLNDGLEKIASKGGMSRKAADLEQVLGPIPSKPAMSAFSFPGPENNLRSGASAASAPLATPVPAAGSPAFPDGNRRTAPAAPAPQAFGKPFVESKQAEPASLAASSPAQPHPLVSSANAASPPMGRSTPEPAPPVARASAGGGAPAVPGRKPPLPPPPQGKRTRGEEKAEAPKASELPPLVLHDDEEESTAVTALRPSLQAMGYEMPASPTPSPGRPTALTTLHGVGSEVRARTGAASAPIADSGGASAGYQPPQGKHLMEEEATAVTQIPEGLLQQATAAEGHQGDEMTEWRAIYEDFVRLKKSNSEPLEGLTFEKFQTTLRKNRDSLMERHGCKRVKFSVYTKEGRAALKASPVKG